jgi:nicotinamidase-related amidase
MKQQALLHGPLSERTLHLCIDMQAMFAEDTQWHTPWMHRVAPMVAAIASTHPDRSIFTRFIPPAAPEQAPGMWRIYFERWRGFTREAIDPGLLELIEPLRRFVPPALVLDKPFYSPFHGTRLAGMLRERGCDGLVVTGAETDMCVLAAVLDAVDLGLRVVIATDAICTSSDEMHDAMLRLYSGRFSTQIETAATEAILSQWA